MARPTFSLDGSDGLSLDGARRRAAAHGSSEQALLLLPFARLITTVPLVAGRSDFTVAAPDEVAQLLLSCKRGVKWLCGTPLGNCTCGSRLMELLQISLRISFGASMCRTCKSHAASELFSHRSSSHAVSVPLWQRLTPLCSACETSNGCKKQVCFRHSGGMMWRLGNSRSERDLSPYKA